MINGFIAITYHCELLLHIDLNTEVKVTCYQIHFYGCLGRLRGLAVACWITDHYHLSSNLGVGISESCFIFDFASLPSEAARPI